MKNNDQKDQRRVQIRDAMQSAINSGDTAAYTQAWDDMFELITNQLNEQYASRIEQAAATADSAVLAARGQRQLTGDERTFYQNLLSAMRAEDPRQAISDLNLTFPITVVDDVFTDLQTNHPLLSEIDFMPANGITRWLMDSGEDNEAQWGDLCDEIVKELAGGFEVFEAALHKLSGLMFTCKSGFEIGPEWLDRYVREVLFEALANGLEKGCVAGTGKKMPIGMDRQVGEGVVVTDGVYPQKALITVNRFDLETTGRLLSMLCVSEKGKARVINKVILVCNPMDYYSKVLPGTMVMGPDGSYRSALPFDVKIVPSAKVALGEAIFGAPKGYFATASLAGKGKIDYSDHYHFAEDERTWIVKCYANGRPKDNNYFLRLDISNLQPLFFQFENLTRTPSSDATLASLAIGALTLSPAFDPDETTYTAATTNATNTIRAVANNAAAEIEIKLGDTVVQNGTALEWAAGSNVVTVKVTAEDGTYKTYTVTVTKS